jgi:uncharacterized protein (DUF1778 family)
MRISPDDKNLITRAALLKGVPISEFIIHESKEDAKNYLDAATNALIKVKEQWKSIESILVKAKSDVHIEDVIPAYKEVMDIESLFTCSESSLKTLCNLFLGNLTNEWLISFLERNNS